jgi:hypothetical protein
MSSKNIGHYHRVNEILTYTLHKHLKSIRQEREQSFRLLNIQILSLSFPLFLVHEVPHMDHSGVGGLHAQDWFHWLTPLYQGILP